MYAVIQSGGKQYRVQPGKRVNIERLEGDVGQEITFDQVLLVGDEESSEFGNPVVGETRVVGTIVEHFKGDKVIVFKFKRRKMYRRKRGHRQQYTGVQIDSIESRGKTARAEVPVKKAAPEVSEAASGGTKPRAAAQKKSQPEAGLKVSRTGAKKSKTTRPASKPAGAKKPSRKATGKKARE